MVMMVSGNDGDNDRSGKWYLCDDTYDEYDDDDGDDDLVHAAWVNNAGGKGNDYQFLEESRHDNLGIRGRVNGSIR